MISDSFIEELSRTTPHSFEELKKAAKLLGEFGTEDILRAVALKADASAISVVTFARTVATIHEAGIKLPTTWLSTEPPALDLTFGYDYTKVLVKHGGSEMSLWDLGLFLETIASDANRLSREARNIKEGLRAYAANNVGCAAAFEHIYGEKP